MLVFNHNTVHSKACMVIFLLLGLSVCANAQSPASKGNTHVIDKSKLVIHQNYRDEQHQRFDNSRSKILAFAGNSHTRTKAHTSKNATHTKSITGAVKKDIHIKHTKHATKAQDIHYKINRKVRKTH